MVITAWRQEKKPDKSLVCRIQLSYKDGRKIKTLLKTLQGWEKCGEGYSPTNKENIVILQRNFEEDKKWKSFLRKFPFRIVERTPTNKERIYNAKKII